jgi:hypothetical protein
MACHIPCAALLDRRCHNDARLMRSALAFAIAWLAAWCQVILVATLSWGALAACLDPLGGVSFCHADAQQGQQPRPQPKENEHVCLLCATCPMHSPSAVVPVPATTTQAQRSAGLVHFATPLPRAPPPAPLIAAPPRGPPS